MLDSDACVLLVGSTAEWDGDGVAHPLCPIRSIDDFVNGVEPRKVIEIELKIIIRVRRKSVGRNSRARRRRALKFVTENHGPGAGIVDGEKGVGQVGT